MRLQKIDSLLLFIALFLVGISFYQKQDDIIIPIPNNPIIIPNKPDLKKNILFDEYENAKKISKEYNKKLVLIFGADWCPYCKDLKKDTDKIQEFKSYIVCFINTDTNKSLVQEYRVRSLPTSIVIFNDKEEARKSGYKYSDYCKWLENNNHGEKTWSDLPL